MGRGRRPTDGAAPPWHDRAWDARSRWPAPSRAPPGPGPDARRLQAQLDRANSELRQLRASAAAPSRAAASAPAPAEAEAPTLSGTAKATVKEEIASLRRSKAALPSGCDELAEALDLKIAALQKQLDGQLPIHDRWANAQRCYEEACRKVKANEEHCKRAQDHLEKATARRQAAEDELRAIQDEVASAPHGTDMDDDSLEDDDRTHEAHAMAMRLHMQQGLLAKVFEQAAATGGMVHLSESDLAVLSGCVDGVDSVHVPAASVGSVAPAAAGPEPDAPMRPNLKAPSPSGALAPFRNVAQRTHPPGKPATDAAAPPSRNQQQAAPTEEQKVAAIAVPGTPPGPHSAA